MTKETSVEKTCNAYVVLAMQKQIENRQELALPLPVQLRYTMPDVANKPRFGLELTLSRHADHVGIDDPTLISDQLLDLAWIAMNEVIMDILDSLGEEPTDEEYRARFLEVCYRLIYREMFTLHTMPNWEKAAINRLGTRERGTNAPRRKKGSYDDSWHGGGL
jgi:hypothetical protein